MDHAAPWIFAAAAAAIVGLAVWLHRRSRTRTVSFEGADYTRLPNGQFRDQSGVTVTDLALAAGLTAALAASISHGSGTDGGMSPDGGGGDGGGGGD